MKKIHFLLTLILLVPVAATAQNLDSILNAHGQAYVSTDAEVVRGIHGVGWVRSHFFDEWFYQIQGGGLVYFGTEDRLGPFKDRLTGAAELHIGRRIFPMFGFRASMGYGYAHGFLSKELYNSDRNSILVHGFSGESGVDQNGDPLGGYYWDYNDELLIHKWKYFYVGVDLFLDLAFFRGTDNYNPNKTWNHIFYGGINRNYGRSETDTTNRRAEAHIGYICKYNFNDNWSVFADLRATAVERLFDREWVPSVERPSFAVDNMLSAYVGLQYKFHIRTQEQRTKFVKQDTVLMLPTTVTHVNYVKMSETLETHIKDTTLTYEYHNVPTPDAQQLINDLEDEIGEYDRQLKIRVMNQPLDSIFINQLLPYEMVFFELDRWEILPTEEMKIDKMARIIKAYPNETFILTGSADSKTGTPYRNDFLSHQRADVVRDMLVNQYGVDPKQLILEYLGGIDDYKPFQLNRCTVIIMNHPTVMKAFEEMKKQGQAGSGEVRF